MEDIVFHPLLVHVPIDFFFLEAFLICLWLRKKEEKYEEFAYIVLRLAVIALPFVMTAGYIDAGGVTSRVRLHFFSAVSVLTISGVRLIMRSRNGIGLWTGQYKRAYMFLLIMTVLLTGLT